MNLLPKTEQEFLKKGLRLRFWIVISEMVTAALVISLVALLPAYVIARVKLIEVGVKAEMAKLNEADVATAKLLALPSEVNGKLAVMRGNTPNHKLSEIIYEVTSFAKSGINIDALSYDGNTNTEGNSSRELIVSGVAAERKVLVSFSESLKQSKTFSVIDVPVSNLAKDRNIPFTIKVIVNN